MNAMTTAAWPPGETALVAILRGLQPERAAEVGQLLFDTGWRLLEVPLNRPGALACIEALARIAPKDALVGAGTVTEVAQVDAVERAGGRLIVSPHTDLAVLARCAERGLLAVPGVFTVSEAFAALRAGAAALKMFPAEAMPPQGLRSLKSVLPEGTSLWPVGGIEPEDLARWRAHGATGFGIGSALFKPEFDLPEIERRARAFMQARGALASPQ
jgi:2-dehydro-3-deoxyphosphogalactonate aldolase